MESEYRAQVALLLRIIPFVAQESVFALKGGTAINLFVQNMPRLSVDIDLTYLPLDDRDTALKNISAALKRIKNKVESTLPEVKVVAITQKENNEATLIVADAESQIKIEVNTIMRGHIFAPRLMSCIEKASNEFETFAEIKVLSEGELYGGKICAALDRQHPRDLFDIHWLLENGGINGEIKLGFMAALLSHPRPINELLSPQFSDQQDPFNKKFSGMTLMPFSYADYEITRKRLVDTIKKSFNKQDKQFLLSFKACEPNWDLIEIKALKDLPAIKWKLFNLQKLKNDNLKKYKVSFEKLEAALNS